MEITAVRQHHLRYDLDGSYEPTWVPGHTQTAHELNLFEVETDAGITGITAGPAFGGFDYEELYESFLVGEDPHHVEWLAEKIESMGVLGSAPWHLEVALWDILGKDVGKPVYRLLGGRRREIPVYASSGELRDPEARVEYVEDRLDEGFDAVKLRFQSDDPETDLEVARAVRAAAPDVTIMVDANMAWGIRTYERENRWTFKEALGVARALEDIGNVGWLEEPLPMYRYDDLAELRRRTTIPIAGGGSISDLHQSHEYIRNDCYDVIQSDAMLATGFLNAKKVAAMAEENGVGFDPHTWGNGITLAANLHAMAMTHSRWCEFPLEPPAWTVEARDFVLTDPLVPTDGALAPPDGPGLGVEVDWDAVEAHRVE